MRPAFRASQRLAAATTVLCFGDSWTDGNAHGLTEQLQKHNRNDVKVINKDYWGSTAEHFAKNPMILPHTVTKHDADIVLLSMGGNDFKNIYWRQKQYVTPWTAVAGIEKNLRTVLDSLFAEHPNVKVVTYGYDFPGSVDAIVNMYKPDTLSTSMKSLFWLYNMVGVRFINYSAMQLGASLERLSKEYTEKGYSFTYVPLWGSLQTAKAVGTSPASSSSLSSILAPTPALGQPSPTEYMRDPIHANEAGYGVLLGNLYHHYFSKVLPPQAVLASA